MLNPCNPVCKASCTGLCLRKKRYLDFLEDHDEDLIICKSKKRASRKKIEILNKNGIPINKKRPISSGNYFKANSK